MGKRIAPWGPRGKRGRPEIPKTDRLLRSLARYRVGGVLLMAIRALGSRPLAATAHPRVARPPRPRAATGWPRKALRALHRNFCYKRQFVFDTIELNQRNFNIPT